MLRRLVPGLFVVAAALPAQQDIIFYKFEGGSGDGVVNFGDPGPRTDRIGQLEPDSSGIPVSALWGPGKHGAGGLAAGVSNQYTAGRVNTGWDGRIEDGEDVTLAFFFRAIWPISTGSVNPMFECPSNEPSLRLQAIGWTSAWGQLRIDWNNAGMNTSTVWLPQDVLTPAYSDWVHIAIVIDRTAGSSFGIIHWYIDGVAQIPLSSNSLYDIVGSIEPWRVGFGAFRFDDVRLSLRAVPPAEIMQWASSDEAADARFADPCVPYGQLALLDNVTGTTPFIGNGAYQLSLFAPYGALARIVVGLDRTNPQDLGTLVNPALSGCLLHPSQDLLLPVVTLPPTGRIDFPFPVPNDPGLVGLCLYAQAVGLNPWTSDWFSTNAFAAALGN